MKTRETEAKAPRKLPVPFAALRIFDIVLEETILKNSFALY